MKFVCWLSRVAGCLLLAGLGSQPLWGQPVRVTATLDTNLVAAGETTMLRVWAQVAPEWEASADRIFTWYVDVENSDGSVAAGDYDAMTREASDNHPETSSSGFDDGAHRRGIYDTFLDLPHAGVSNAVELLAVPVTGVSGGTTRFSVEAGSGVDGLISDFTVAPLGAGDLFYGGNYEQAFVDLEVSEPCAIELTIERVNGGGPGQPLRLLFDPCLGYEHTVEYKNFLEDGEVWQSLPGAPHNAGMVTVTNSVDQRYFRVRIEAP